MKTAVLLLALGAAALLGGCAALSGESTAPKPDPARFLPKGVNGAAGGPPASSPTAK